MYVYASVYTVCARKFFLLNFSGKYFYTHMYAYFIIMYTFLFKYKNKYTQNELDHQVETM